MQQADSNKTYILVIGANGGLGMSMINSLLNQGTYHILAADKNLSSLPNHPAVDHFHIDLSIPNQFQVNLQSIFEQYTTISLVINCAAVCPQGNIMTFQSSSIQNTININLTSAITIINESINYFIKQKIHGMMISVSSNVVDMTINDLSIYSASKTSLSLYSRLMADYASAYGIQVLCYEPGAMDTLMGLQVVNGDNPLLNDGIVRISADEGAAPLINIINHRNSMRDVVDVTSTTRPKTRRRYTENVH